VRQDVTVDGGVWLCVGCVADYEQEERVREYRLRWDPELQREVLRYRAMARGNELRWEGL
jgi:hypothetical protein